MRPVLRFAPSPNGRLHLGHAYSALLNDAFARRLGGRFLLRMEDIDLTRCRPAFEAALLDDLSWLGLSWETPVRRQSEHFGEYRAAAERLRDRGILYPCFCSRKEVAADAAARAAGAGEPWPRDPDGAPLYPGRCRALPVLERERRVGEGRAHAWRLDGEAARRLVGALSYGRFGLDGGEDRVAAEPARWGDAVVVRKEIPTSYHLSVVADDALQGVTHVVRGADLEAATDLHVLLQALLGLPTPRYHHHPLLRDEGGDKLSKSLRSRPLAELRAEGTTPEAIRRALGFEAQPTPST
jgi:glutamyl-Q tRNA(Asp) synthetase